MLLFEEVEVLDSESYFLYEEIEVIFMFLYMALHHSL